MKTCWSGFALMLFAALASAEPAKLVRSSELRTKPAIDAPVQATLAEGATVELLGTEGGWSRVKSSDGKSGFVRLLNLRTSGTAGSTGPLSGIGILGGVARTGSTGATATTGVKGITKDDLARAEPNPADVAQLEHYAASAGDARTAAKTGKLVAQSVPSLGEK